MFLHQREVLHLSTCDGQDEFPEPNTKFPQIGDGWLKFLTNYMQVAAVTYTYSTLIKNMLNQLLNVYT